MTSTTKVCSALWKRRRPIERMVPVLCSGSRTRRVISLNHCRILAVMLLATPSAAWALVTGEAIDRVADVLAVVVLIVAPLAGIYLFWKVHILPEMIAEKRHHPQKDAIRALCLLSLIFGGLLWPFALVWAYMRPAGRDLALARERRAEGEGVDEDRREPRLALLRSEIDQLSEEGVPQEDLELLKRDLTHIRAKLAPRPELH